MIHGLMNLRRILFCCCFALGASAFARAPKYLILFIGDGMSTPQRMIADEFSRKVGRGPLAMDTLPYQAVTRTCSADSLVTDSAAAATAIACGVKTQNGRLGVDTTGSRAVSCAEVAKAQGRKVGIVTSVTVTHATPGGFYAHRTNRGDTYGIALELANSGFDFFAGGGLGVSDKASRAHAQYATCGDAYAYCEKKGYQIVTSRAAFLALKPGCGKILTKFVNGPLDYTIDVTPETNQPTLAELTAKAIEVLDGDAGFFMMVEGGRIDWAGHANDAATNLRDVLALDSAVQVALDFQQKYPDETLVVVTGDHETGGLSMGFSGTGYALYMERLAGQTMSVGVFDSKVRKLNATQFDDVKPLITQAFGLKFPPSEALAAKVASAKDPMRLTASELDEIRRAYDHDIAFHKAKIEENTKYDGEKRYLLGGVCRLIVSHKSGIGWSSAHHTALPVLTSAKGCGADRFVGYMENTDIARKIKALYDGE